MLVDETSCSLDHADGDVDFLSETAYRNHDYHSDECADSCNYFVKDRGRYFVKNLRIRWRPKRHINKIVCRKEHPSDNSHDNDINRQTRCKPDQNHQQNRDNNRGRYSHQDQPPIATYLRDLLLSNIDLKSIKDLLPYQLAFRETHAIEDCKVNQKDT